MRCAAAPTLGRAEATSAARSSKQSPDVGDNRQHRTERRSHQKLVVEVLFLFLFLFFVPFSVELEIDADLAELGIQ
jgi:hypothetical protein